MAGRATVGEQLVKRFAGVEILCGRERRRQHDACCGNSPKNHQRRDEFAPRSNERSQCRPLARGSRSRRQQLIELGRSIGLAILIGDDDPPPFARPNLRLRHDEQPALAGKTALFIIAFCDHFIGQCASPCVALHPFSRGSGLWRQFAGSVAIWCPPQQHCARHRFQPSDGGQYAASSMRFGLPGAGCYANPSAVQTRQPGAGPSPPRRNRSYPAIRLVDADDVWTAEINQPLHSR